MAKVHALDVVGAVTRQLFGKLAMVLALLACSLVGTAASAQPVRVRQELAAGERAAHAGDWHQALEAFRRADGLAHSASTATRLADALYHLGDPVAAHAAYHALLDEFGSALFAKSRQAAAHRLDELAGKTGLLTVRVGEAGALVRLDGKAVGSSPLAKPVRLSAGKHRLTVSKDGFQPSNQTVALDGGAKQSVEVVLSPHATGEIEVRAAGDAALEVIIDGKRVGTTPYRGELPAGRHEIAGRAGSAEAPAQRVDLEAGGHARVTLAAAAAPGRLEVRIASEQGAVFIDGDKVGDGGFAGELDAGPHRVQVKREGYQLFDKRIRVESGEVQVQTVALRKAAAGDEQAEWEEGDWSFDGLYGGLVASFFFQPAGSGHTLEVACDTTGATSCDAGTPAGGGFGGYLGYAIAPVGIELLLIGSGDAVQPSAEFDGVHGSDINPLVASPARDEQFIIGRFGGGGAVRARLLYPIGRFRISGAAGLGLGYKYALLGRESTASSGATSKVSDDGKGYLSPALSAELGAQLRLGGTVSLALGLELWLEHAGDGLATEPQPDVALSADGQPPQPQATGAYDMASGPQLFLGPYLGAQFGP